MQRILTAMPTIVTSMQTNIITTIIVKNRLPETTIKNNPHPTAIT